MAFVDSTIGARVIKEGYSPIKVVLAAACKVGDLLGYSSGWVLADMDSSPKVYPELVAGEAGAIADEITAYRRAVIDFGSGCTATAGDPVYATTVGGGYSSSSGDQGFTVGVMATAQIAFIEPQNTLPTIRDTRDRVNTTGTAMSIQLKPKLTVGGASASLNPLEISARVDSGIVANEVVGLKAGVDLKGAAGGNVALARCIEANLESASGSTRTVAAACGLEFMNNLHGTVTAGPYCMKVNTHGGNKAWAGLLLLPDDGQIASDSGAITLDGHGWIKVVIKATTLYIPVGTKD